MELQNSLKDLINELEEGETLSCFENIDRGNFFETLSTEEKLEISKLFLSRAQKKLLNRDLLFEEKMIPLIVAAENLAPTDPEILFSLGSLFFRLGAITEKKHYLFFALDKMGRTPES